MKYSNYLKSQDWREKQVRKRFKKNRCAICASTERLDVHHLVYKDLISITDADLRVLCRRCHFLCHDLYKRGRFKFRSDNHNSRFAIIKVAVKKELGITKKNMFIS